MSPNTEEISCSRSSVASMIPRTPPIDLPQDRTSSLRVSSKRSIQSVSISPKSSGASFITATTARSDSEFGTPISTNTDPFTDNEDNMSELAIDKTYFQQETPRNRKASTSLITQDAAELRKILGSGETSTKLIQKYCCGGNCCLLKKPVEILAANQHSVPQPDNDAFRSLKLDLRTLSLETELTGTIPLPARTSFLCSIASAQDNANIALNKNILQPPSFVQPHPPYHVYQAPVFHARELTKAGAEKRTIHFDIDVTDYPEEAGVDFIVGGAVGICPPNEESTVEEVLDRLGVPRFVRDKPVLLKTTGGRWPTIWGEDEARELHTTRRELLTWCSDLQSAPPTKQILRVLAEYAHDPYEKKILSYLVSAEGQGAFCDLRTGPHLTLSQLLHAFPSSHPPLEALFGVLKQLMPRFYSLSNDPCISSNRNGLVGRRIIEMAVSVHENEDWKSGVRTGLCSGYLERIAKQYLSEGNHDKPLYIPMFRGLMSNPLTKEFSDGPMLLIGAGVGMAPFRGFILNRLKKATCVNKVWLLQGVRDSSLDEIYQGEFGMHEKDVKRVVQSRKHDGTAGEAKYVQDEVIHQEDIVWFVINSVDGRVCVCGSSKGMGEGVWDALVRVAMSKGAMNRDEAENFWKSKEESGQYVAETW